jgi:quercetin dioxygenase-like cupin family protein
MLDQEKAPIPGMASDAQGQLIVFDLRALTRFRPDGPNVTVLSDTGAARTVLFALQAGQHLPEHDTSSQILVQVVRGRITFTAAGSSVEARAGTVLQLEAGVRHALVARTNAVVLLTLTPSPARHSLERETFANLTPLVVRSEG